MKKCFIIITMFLAAFAARAFDFSAVASTGQTVYYTIIGGTTNVKVVNPDWDSHLQPSGFLTLPATVTHNSITYHVTAIDIQAFSNCEALTGISVPEGVSSIGRMAFAFCSSLDSIVLPTTLTEIGTMAFTSTAYFTDNTNIDSAGLMFIGPYVIAARRTINEAVVVPEGTLGLGNMAFYSCDQMPQVILPSSLHFIGENAFGSCTALDTVKMQATVPPTLESNSFMDVANVIIAVPCNTGATYLAAPNWSALTIAEICDTTGPVDPIVPIRPIDPSHPNYPRFPEDPIPAPEIQKPVVVGIEDAELQPLFTAVAVEGGLHIELPDGYGCTVRDVLGRTIATLRNTGFVPLKSKGLYLVESPLLRKTLKVIFSN